MSTDPVFIENRIQEIINSVVNIILEHVERENDVELFIFGSRAHQNGGAHSDIDLALSSTTVSDKAFQDIKRDVNNIRTLYTIDLVFLQKVDADFKKIITSEAVKIYG